MQVNVIRGSHQIGGSIGEVISKDTRIILDVGCELGEEEPCAPSVNGLFVGEANTDAVLISHYHGDHLGLIEQVLNEVPVYMGAHAYAVYEAQQSYAGKESRKLIHCFNPGEKFSIGSIRVIPLLCDHSAFDSYMFLLESEDDCILYTGDFRSNGRKSFKRLLSQLPKVNKLIIEGTTLSGKHALAKTESELEEEAIQMISQVGSAPIFVNMASTNIDRIVTFFRAAKRCGRIFLEDTYTASITTAIGGNIPNPAFPEVKVFLTRPNERDYTILQQFPKSKIGKTQIARERFVMMVRPSMIGYLKKLAEKIPFAGGILFYSLWSGYKHNHHTSKFLNVMKELGLTVLDLHTSGHADMNAIEELIERTSPKEIIPIHTENPEWFDKFCN